MPCSLLPNKIEGNALIFDCYLDIKSCILIGFTYYPKNGLLFFCSSETTGSRLLEVKKVFLLSISSAEASYLLLASLFFYYYFLYSLLSSVLSIRLPSCSFLGASSVSFGL
jgi:hypothetical protein